ncbi:MAG: IS110 family transposase [Hyphomonadaceae bacterium]|nr:IS110 family transposase [Hyphomonadaceae bacterium]
MAKLYVGLDVSDATTSICVIDAAGAIVIETVVDTTPDAIAAALKPYRTRIAVLGHEAGALSQWLHKGLVSVKLPVRCLDAAHAHAALAAQRHKTDRNDALGIARMVRAGWGRDAWVRSPEAARLRTALVFRRTLKRKVNDLEHCIRQSYKSFGVKVGAVGHGRFAERLRTAVQSDPVLSELAEAILRARDALLREHDALDKRLQAEAADDGVCQRLMTVPGIGPITALTFKATVDDPARFAKSRNVGVYFGLTPRRRQSGAHEGSGSISKRGDIAMRSLLCSSARIFLRSRRDSRLKSWGLALAGRTKKSVAWVAVARRLGAVLHRIWVTGGEFEFLPDAPA